MLAAMCGADWGRPPSMRMWPFGVVFSTDETPPPTYQVLPKMRNGSRGWLQAAHGSQSCGGSGTSSAGTAGAASNAASSGQYLQ